MNTQPTKKRKRRKVSNCKAVVSGQPCTGKYALSYATGAPIFTCELCGNTDLTWKKFYDEYLQLFNDKDNWDAEKHKISCIIGFFCHMYKEFYNTDYIFVPQNPNPYSSKECKNAQELLVVFKGNAHETRRYIYWLFKKVIKKSTAIVSFGYINTPDIIRKYMIYSQRKNKLDRSSLLPQSFIEWCKINTSGLFAKYELSTMNDLGALLTFVGQNELLKEENDAIKKAIELGLVTADKKLNIG